MILLNSLEFARRLRTEDHITKKQALDSQKQFPPRFYPYLRAVFLHFTN